MPTPLTYQKIQTSTGPISIPIYNIGDVANNSFRVMTSKGLGCYDLIPPTATTPFRVMTSSGVMGINMNTVVTVNRNNIRYVREWLGGNTIDNMRIWAEIQVKNAAGTNLALNKPVTHSVPPDGTWYSKEQVNDGIVDMAADNNSGVVGPTGDYATPLYIQIDLQAGYPITEIKVWHDYLQSRQYQSVKLEISEDGSVWETLFNSEVDGRYTETAAGKTYVVSTTDATILVLSDTFTKANSTTSLGTATTGQVWQKYDHRSAVYGISANQAYPAVVDWDFPAFVEIGISDNYDYSIKLAVVGSGNQIMWRIAGDLNFLIISGSNVRRVVNNTWTTIGTIPTLVSGDVVKIRVRGSVHTIFVNGIQRAQVTESAHLTATKVGFSTNSTTSRWDDITVHRL